MGIIVEKQAIGLAQNGKRKKARNRRTLFSNEQLTVLERRFSNGQYLKLDDRAILANQLGLSQTQVNFIINNEIGKYFLENFSNRYYQ